MTTTPPPYGSHPPAPQPPTRYRPSAGWFVGGVVLILIAGVVAVASFVYLLAGFLDSDATVRADGQPHRVSVGTDGDRMLWLEDDNISCSIVDLATGEQVDFRRINGSYERSDGTDELEGIYRFAPGSGNLEVTCATGPFADQAGTGTVLISQMPEVESVVLGVILVVVIPGLLGLAGLVMLIWTGILWSLRDPRPKGA